MIRILLVHDTHLLRSALAALVEREDDFEVFAAPWTTAALRARSLRPDVCVVDVESPNSAGLTEVIEQCTRTAGEGPGLLVLATPTRPGLLRRAYEARARGFVNKDGSPQCLVDAIRKVAVGHRFVDDTLAYGFLEAAEMPLTARELNVLSLAAEGASISEIARSLHLCNGTVRNYMAAITRKTGARNRVDAIRISQGAGWL